MERILNQKLCDSIFVSVGRDANFMHDSCCIAGVASLRVARETEMDEAHWLLGRVQVNGKLVRMEERFAQNALIPDAYGARASGVKNGVMFVPKIG